MPHNEAQVEKLAIDRGTPCPLHPRQKEDEDEWAPWDNDGKKLSTNNQNNAVFNKKTK